MSLSTPPRHPPPVPPADSSAAPGGSVLFPPRAAAEVAAERELLAELNRRGAGARLWGYTKMSGPGWLQSAFSLGGGSLASSLFAGALLGYALLWVQPLAMVAGVVMLSAMAYVTLHTHDRPMQVVSRGVHPAMAWAWAIGSLIASLVWVLPQYSISVDVIGDMAGRDFGKGGGFLVALALLAVVTGVAWNYGSAKGVRVFEGITRLLVALIIVSFAVVVLWVGVRLGWDAVLAGYFGFSFPLPGRAPAATAGWEPVLSGLQTQGGVTPDAADAMKRSVGTEGFNLVLAGFSAAVGINMTFLFPYSLRARGWGREHGGLARFDLWTGMLIPFAVVTSLLIIASANQFYGMSEFGDLFVNMVTGGKKPGSGELARALEPWTGPVLAHWVFGLGVLGMTLSSIVMMMLVSGFVVMELTARPFGSLAHRIGMLLPAVGVLGPVIWSETRTYLAVPTSVLNLILLPIAYISFWILINRRSVLGDAKPTGGRLVAWNAALGCVVLVVTAAAGYTAYLNVGGWLTKLLGSGG